MAVNYTDLFEDVGEFVEVVNLFYGWTATELPGALSEISTQLHGNGRLDDLEGVHTTFVEYRDQTMNWCLEMADKAWARMRNKEAVLDELDWTYSGAGPGMTDQQFLEILWRDMVANTITVDRTTCAVGSVSAGSGNVGTGSVLTTKILDGVTKPLQGAFSVPGYKGVNSELMVNGEEMKLTCISDSESDGATEGSERFRWDGYVLGRNGYDWLDNGSGEGPDVVVANSDTYATNGEFEDFETANVPDDWTVDSGVAGTEVFQDTADFHRGASSLKFTGTATATIQVSQDMSDVGLVPNKGYAVAVWVKGEAGIVAGALTIQFEGTGYTAGATEKITMNAAALAAATSYTLKSFFVNMPATIPTDFKLVIEIASTLTATKRVRFDGLVVTPVIWHGGMGVVVVAGATPFLRQDIFTWTNTNDGAGAFQEYFRKHKKCQLSSSGAPSVSDALASD